LKRKMFQKERTPKSKRLISNRESIKCFRRNEAQKARGSFQIVKA
jgi:hypothetical protein